MTILFWFSCLVIPLVLLCFLAWVWRFRSADTPTSSIDWKTCSVIIPFRNEAEVLPRLLDSIRSLNAWPCEFIFCNDHSNDESNQLLEQFSAEHPLVRCIDNAGEGKKQAIYSAVHQASGEYIITWDADISVSPDYFLTHVPEADLVILPVAMNGRSGWGAFFAWEYLLFNALNIWLSPIYVLSASGANLLFSKSIYLSVASRLVDSTHLSGDDYWLLRSLQKENRRIKVVISPELTVETVSVDRWMDYLVQRGRWLGKTTHDSDWRAMSMGILILLYFAATVGIMLVLLIQQYWIGLFVFVVFRFFLEISIYSYAMRKMQKKIQPLAFLFYQTVYPCLIGVTVVYAFFFRPTWKGREISRSF
jgi:poly-beta-1,6-N-acetyl-D-glucosamine synthase